ncbi:MAG: hypothetical protein E4H26_07215 [Flavobacteriales bacterium]|nr:MAG: hypothetical protein E4H26_07215 [Flavobacteriales bacterium]
MGRCVFFFCSLVVLLILMSFGFSTPNYRVPESLRVTQQTEYLYPQQFVVLKPNLAIPPFLGTSYVGFKEALAFKESRGNYFSMNTLGYLGKYQFGIGTLQLMGVYNATRFLNDPVLQEKVFYTNMSRNKWILRRDIQRFVGKRIGGVEITESGMLAAAHLAGPGNVKKYLRSWGARDTIDVYGTAVSIYIKKFSGYDLSHVSPKKNPKI